MSRWAVDREYAPRQAVGLCRFGELFLGYLTQGSYLLMRSKLKQSHTQGPCLSNLPMAMLGDLVGIVVFPMPDSVTQSKETKIQQY